MNFKDYLNIELVQTYHHLKVYKIQSKNIDDIKFKIEIEFNEKL